MSRSFTGPSAALSCGLFALLLIVALPAEATTCVERTWNHGGYSLSAQDNAEHWSGKHRVAATFLYQCACDTSCRSSCYPSFGATQCTDSGVKSPGIVHIKRTKHRIKGGSKPNAIDTGLDCGAGYACFVKSCIDNSACPNFTIGAEVRPLNIGMGIEFTTASGDIIWDGQVDFPFQCDSCTTVSEANSGVGEPENNPDIQDPESGDGGGGLPGGCRWRCVTRFYGQGGEGARVEDCSLIC